MSLYEEVAKEYKTLRDERDALLSALLEIKVRIAYIGMPQEPMWHPSESAIDADVPDWRDELQAIEQALRWHHQREAEKKRGSDK